MIVREDLSEAHRLAWATSPARHLVVGVQRVELASTALQAIADPDPLPPWIRVSTTDRLGPAVVAPRAAHDVAYRIARHAGTMTVDVYRAATDEIDELPYVELCAIVSTVAAVAHFCRNIGVAVPPLPALDRARRRGPARSGSPGAVQLGPGRRAGRRGRGGRPGLHRGPRRAAQHLAHGRRAVHAGRRHGRSRLVTSA